MIKTNLFSLLLLAVFCLACATDDGNLEPKTLYTGQKVDMGNGMVWSIVNTNPSGEPQSIGVQFDASALTALPSGPQPAHEFTIQLPDGISVPPYDHLTVDWNEHGHEPAEVYDLPHFDLHFYMMSTAERDIIGPIDTVAFNKPLPGEYLAPMYLETPGGVPRMGAHIIDLLSPEIAGTGTFTHTFIYGKYDGHLNFLEPMVTKAFLESKEPVTQEIRQPASWEQSGYYPKRYTITYDSATNTYSVLLTDLTNF